MRLSPAPFPPYNKHGRVLRRETANKIAHISVRDNRKSDFTEKQQTFVFFNIFRRINL